MSHVKLTGDVWRGNDNGERGLRAIHISVEKILLEPKFIPLGFHILKIISLW
jgi:hypothetical protein